MAYDPTDAVTARALFEDAIGLGSTPDLTVAQVDTYFGIASSLDDDGLTVVYTPADLNRVAAQVWRVKAGLTADRYDLGAGTGRTLDESQWHRHCRGMAADYAAGAASVTGEAITSRRGIGSIRMITGADGVPA